MKQLSALALLVSSVAIANQSVTVTGSGDTLTEAKRDALYQASMRHCPTTVVNDREYRNDTMSRNNLTAYNGCLVKNYTLLNQENNGRYYSVTINAEVVPNHLSARIINAHPDWFYYDLNGHNDRVAQLSLKEENAKDLIDEIFYDFTSNAFTVNHTPFKVTYQGRQGYLNVAYKVTYNRNFLVALDETFNILKDKSQGQWQSTFASMFQDKSIRYAKNAPPQPVSMTVYKKYIFNDRQIFQQVRGYLNDNRPFVRVQVVDENDNVQVNVCHQLQWYNFYSTGEFWENKFNTSGKDEGYLQIPLPLGLSDDSKISLDVVSRSFCEQFY